MPNVANKKSKGGGRGEGLKRTSAGKKERGKERERRNEEEGKGND